MTRQLADRQSSRGSIFGKRQRVFFSPTSQECVRACVCQGISTEVNRPRRRAGHSLNLALGRRISAGERQGRSPAEILGSNPTGGMDICLL